MRSPAALEFCWMHPIEAVLGKQSSGTEQAR